MLEMKRFFTINWMIKKLRHNLISTTNIRNMNHNSYQWYSLLVKSMLVHENKT